MDIENTAVIWEQRAKNLALSDPSAIGVPKLPKFAEINIPKGINSVLDMGSGYGRFSIPLAKKGISVVALDLSPSMLKRLKRNIQRLERNVEIYTVYADMRFPPFKKGVFDLVICVGTFFYLPYPYWYSTIGTFCRVLQKEGNLFIHFKRLKDIFPDYRFSVRWVVMSFILIITIFDKKQILLNKLRRIVTLFPAKISERALAQLSVLEIPTSNKKAKKLLSEHFHSVAPVDTSDYREILYLCSRPK